MCIESGYCGCKSGLLPECAEKPCCLNLNPCTLSRRGRTVDHEKTDNTSGNDAAEHWSATVCNFKSFVCTKDKVYAHVGIDSHSDLIEMFGLQKLEQRIEAIGLVKVELLPPDDAAKVPDFSTWTLKVDQDIIPDWWDEAFARTECEAWLESKTIRENLSIFAGQAELCFANIEQIKGGCHIVRNYGIIGTMRESSSVKTMRGSSSVNEMRESSSVNEMRGSSSVKTMRESSSVNEMWESSSVNEMRGSSSVKTMRESSSVNEMWESSSVNEMWGSSSVKTMRESSSVNEMRESSSVNEMRESSSVKTMRGSSSVKTMRGSSSAEKKPIADNR